MTETERQSIRIKCLELAHESMKESDPRNIIWLADYFENFILNGKQQVRTDSSVGN